MMYVAFVNGEAKGNIWKLNGRWRWQRGADRTAVESYPRKASLEDVRKHIGFVCRSDQVRLQVKV